MKRKRITAASSATYKVVLITLDAHMASAFSLTRTRLSKLAPDIELSFHAASDWDAAPDSLESCIQDITDANLIIVNMLFLENHVNAILQALTARQPHCDAMICCLAAAEITRLTRMGKFRMDKPSSGAISILKKLRGKTSDPNASDSGERQLRVLRRLPKILRYIPGTAQDVRAYFLTLQYWLAGSSENLFRMFSFLLKRYSSSAESTARLSDLAPIDYPDTGVYHPAMAEKFSRDDKDLPVRNGPLGTVGILLMRSYLLAGDTRHYDAVIEQLEDAGYNVIPAFASGLDSRPAVERFFLNADKPKIDLLLSLTGFSLVGGPAYNDSRAAEALLSRLNVPYFAAHALEFQSLEQWAVSAHGLMPVEATMMVAIPELDGATNPMVFGGRSGDAQGRGTMQASKHRVERLIGRIDRAIKLRAAPLSDKKIAVVLFNFPPHAANVGTAAHLSVFRSLFNLMQRLQKEGYTVDMPDSVDALREQILSGNAEQHGMPANVTARISADDFVAQEPFLDEIEAQWGPTPGRLQTDGRSLFVLGKQFGNLLVGIQPGFGYEGDPMKLLFERGFAPTHAFSAFYRYIDQDFGAHALLHFGTHGALEFMPGKQTGLADDCWPDRLLGNLPNLYVYAANNPSEGLIAKRRSAATLLTYMTPPIAQVQLYAGLNDLKQNIVSWNQCQDRDSESAETLLEVILELAHDLDLETTQQGNQPTEALVASLQQQLAELEATLVPIGLHTLGETPTCEQQADIVRAFIEANYAVELSKDEALLLTGNADAAARKALLAKLAIANEAAPASVENVIAGLGHNQELDAVCRALRGEFIPPAPGGDLIRTPDVLPTGRNMHGFDPFRLPSRVATLLGQKQAERVLGRHVDDGHELPETVALVLWGTDNLKQEGAPIAQALALMGAEPRMDSYGRVSGARLIPLETLGRPRIDVMVTLSGIFRDLLPLQTRMLAEAALLCASAEEPGEQNFIRKHALAWMAETGGDLETAALRVFSNADGAYGSNVNMLIDSGAWDDDNQLAETFTNRKCFAYREDGKPVAKPELMTHILNKVDFAYQNLESAELGVTTIDHYFDTLGGISRAVKSNRGSDIPVYISDQSTGPGKVRTLGEQVNLETRTRMLNPQWYEKILEHGFEGVRQIEAHVTNTMGWSATTGQVNPWVYQKLTETFVLDEDMRNLLSSLNPAASLKFTQRLLEAHQRAYWEPDQETLAALENASEDIEDLLEGLGREAAA